MGKNITAKAKKFPGVKIETKIKDHTSFEGVAKLLPGGAYGHIVEIGKLRALWPLPLKVRCALKDTRQLTFRQSGEVDSEFSSWEWSTTLFPDRVGGEQERLLICLPQKLRKEDRITVKVSGDDREEDLILKVPLE